MVIGRLPRIFYGWWIVAAGFMIQLLVGALLNQAYGAYVVLLQREFGWTKTMLSGAYSLTRVESGLLGPLQGWLMDRLGPRALMRVGMLLFGGGFIAFSQIESAWQFYVAFALMALGSSLAGFFPLTVAIVNWFERRRATALALMSMGFAVGGLLVPAVVLMLDHFGWRATALASGVLILVAGLPLVQMVRFRPEHYGMTVDGDPLGRTAPGATPSATAGEPADFDAAQALRTPAFWLISLGHGAALLVVGAVMVHLVSHLHGNLGYSLAGAALIVTLMTAMQVAGQLLGGFLGDRFEKRLIATLCMAMHAAGLLLVAYATATWMAIAFAVLHGLAWGTRGPLMQAMRADYFGRRSFGTIMGFSSLIVMFGQVSGPLLAGVLADRTGSYESGFTILAALAGFGSVFFILATKPRPKAATAGASLRQAAGAPGD
ncbi:MAG TPA: MFS transporter [Dehalococcoidia bacterium]|nr:MFS transporter [Dehalococcoidia bacterium]